MLERFEEVRTKSDFACGGHEVHTLSIFPHVLPKRELEFPTYFPTFIPHLSHIYPTFIPHLSHNFPTFSQIFPHWDFPTLGWIFPTLPSDPTKPNFYHFLFITTQILGGIRMWEKCGKKCGIFSHNFPTFFPHSGNRISPQFSHIFPTVG